MANFKDIRGYEGYYKIDEHGTIVSLDRFVENGYGGYVRKGKVMKQHINAQGYYSLRLHKENKGELVLVHRLIAEAFIPNHENKPQINHIDGNKLNNSLNNLEWTTQKENVQHGYDIGLNTNVGENNYNTKLTEEQVFEIKELGDKHTRIELGKMFNVDRKTIGHILLGHTWKHLGGDA